MIFGWKKVATFACGVLFGTAGIGILGSEDAKKLYTSCTAAVLRCKDAVLERKDIIQENACDIYEDAKAINEKRAEERRAKEYADAKAIVEACDAAEAAE